MTYPEIDSTKIGTLKSRKTYPPEFRNTSKCQKIIMKNTAKDSSSMKSAKEVNILLSSNTNLPRIRHMKKLKF